MTDLDAKIRLQILVSNYLALSTKKSAEEKENAERVIGELTESVIGWLEKQGAKHQVTLQHACDQLGKMQKYFSGDKDFKFLFSQLNNRITQDQKRGAPKQREIASLTQAAFLLLHLEAVDYFPYDVRTNLEPALRKAIPTLPLRIKAIH